MPAKVHSYGPSDGYKLYLKENKEETPLTFQQYKEILNAFNKRVTEAVLEGHKISLGGYLSFVYIQRVKRKFELNPDDTLKKPSINQYETKKLKAEGINKNVYWTTPYYFRWNWKKVFCSVKGKSAWKFTPTKGVGGTKTMLGKLLKDETTHIRFQ